MARTDVSAKHPSDDRLFEAAIDPTSASAAAVHLHVEACAPCRERWARVTRGLDTWREAAEAEADAVFTDDRLERQRDRVAARIDSLTRGAHIVAFPALRPRTFGRPRGAGLGRWVALAAAAGLVIGVGVGRLSIAPSQQSVEAGPATAAVVAAHGPERATPPARSANDAPLNEEQFLAELEESVARSRSRIRELQAIDQLTPRFRTMTADLR